MIDRQPIRDTAVRDAQPLVGPSAAAALGLHLPSSHWERYAAAAAERRIRQQPVRCACPADPDALDNELIDGRCSRCWGWPKVTS
jgi:hypothetical protein